ncbi:MAG: NHL repeat-containing protein [Actinomycetes bacterium]
MSSIRIPGIQPPRVVVLSELRRLACPPGELTTRRTWGRYIGIVLAFVAMSFVSLMFAGPASANPIINYSLASSAQPSALAIDSSNNVFTADFGTSTVSKITSGGVVSSPFASLAAGATPYGIAIDSSNVLYTANTGTNTVSKITPAGAVTDVFASLALPPQAIAVDTNVGHPTTGYIYTANAIPGGSSSVSEINPAGTVVHTYALPSGADPYSLAVDSSGNVYTANSGANTVSKIDPAAVTVSVFATLASDAQPYGIGVDASDRIYSINTGNNTIARVTAGSATVFATLDSSASPFGVTFDASGNLYTANTGNSTISKITTGGAVTAAFATLAGTANPYAARINSLGTLYTANYVNSTVSSTDLRDPQTINFAALANKDFGSAPFLVSATATSGLPVTFNSSTTGVCTTSGGFGDTVTLVAPGLCTINANQAGSATFAPS